MARQAIGSQIIPCKKNKGSKTEAAEFIVETDGLSFESIFGECESEHFIVIPNFGLSVSESAPEFDAWIAYNSL